MAGWGADLGASNSKCGATALLEEDWRYCAVTTPVVCDLHTGHTGNHHDAELGLEWPAPMTVVMI